MSKAEKHTAKRERRQRCLLGVMVALMLMMLLVLAYFAFQGIRRGAGIGLDYFGQPIDGILQLIGIVVAFPVLVFCMWKYVIKGESPKGDAANVADRAASDCNSWLNEPLLRRLLEFASNGLSLNCQLPMHVVVETIIYVTWRSQ